MASRGRNRTMPTDAAVAKFLYTIMKQLDLKSIDWNAVADELQITNGHAARMRYSRFKKSMEDDGSSPKQPKVPGQRKRKEKADTGGEPEKKRKKDSKTPVETRPSDTLEAMTGVESSTPLGKTEPAAKTESLVKREKDVKQELLDPALQNYPVAQTALPVKAESADAVSGSTTAQHDIPDVIMLDPEPESYPVAQPELRLKVETSDHASGNQVAQLDAVEALLRMSGSPVRQDGITEPAMPMSSIGYQPEPLPDFFSSEEEIQAMKEHEEAILGPQTAIQKPKKRIEIELRD